MMAAGLILKHFVEVRIGKAIEESKVYYDEEELK